MSETEKKKTRRQWTYDLDTNVITTNEMSFNLDDLTEDANLFAFLYGFKQFEADCLAVAKPIVLTKAEIIERLTKRFKTLCDDKFKLVHTESGFYFKDPDAVATRGGSVMPKKIYDACIEDGKTPEEATAFTLQITGKTYPEKE